MAFTLTEAAREIEHLQALLAEQTSEIKSLQSQLAKTVKRPDAV
jgi:hypothetical protein